jgi:hypothetical protein
MRIGIRLKSGHGRGHHQTLGGAIDLDGDMLLPHLLLHLLHLPLLMHVHKNVVLRYTITIAVYPKNHQRSSDLHHESITIKTCSHVFADEEVLQGEMGSLRSTPASQSAPTEDWNVLHRHRVKTPLFPLMWGTIMRWAEADKIGKIDLFSPETTALEKAREQSACLACHPVSPCIFSLPWRFAKEIQRGVRASFAKHQVGCSRPQWQAAICLHPLS